MHYYLFNIADYRKDTSHLTPLEHHIYRTLIDWYYLDESPIPKDNRSVMRRLSLGSQSEARALQNVLNDFFIEKDDGFFHQRIDKDILEYHHKCEKNRENGKKGGRPKIVDKPHKTQSVNLANPLESESNPNQEPITNNHKPIKKYKKENEETFFNIFWDIYPKKVGKDAARKAFEKIANKNILIEEIKLSLQWQIKSPQWTESDGKYIPNPSTYLNQGRWQDQPLKRINPINGSDLLDKNLDAVKDWRPK